MIDAMVISCGEPQLERCLESVRNQTVQFSNIIHVDGVVPEATATNMGIEQVTQEWYMRIDGDIILFPNAVEIALEQIEKSTGKLGMLVFYVYDSFFWRLVTAGAVLTNTEAVRTVGWSDHLHSDNGAKRNMERRGWIGRAAVDGGRKVAVGTHFDKPSEFQVFHRMLINAVKWKHSPKVHSLMKGKLAHLRQKTNDPIYDLAWKAYEYGLENPVYIGSQNRDYDRERYEDFLSRG
jgi:glycosyltransferase involved in cell wall biosynthesis